MTAGTMFRRARSANIRALFVGWFAALVVLAVWGARSTPVTGQSNAWWEAALAHGDALGDVLITAFGLAIGPFLVGTCAVAVLFSWGRSDPAPLTGSGRVVRAALLAAGHLGGWWMFSSVVPALFGSVGSVDFDAATFTIRPSVAAWHAAAGITIAFIIYSTAWVLTDPEGSLGLRREPGQPRSAAVRTGPADGG